MSTSCRSRAVRAFKNRLSFRASGGPARALYVGPGLSSVTTHGRRDAHHRCRRQLDRNGSLRWFFEFSAHQQHVQAHVRLSDDISMPSPRVSSMRTRPAAPGAATRWPPRRTRSSGASTGEPTGPRCRPSCPSACSRDQNLQVSSDQRLWLFRGQAGMAGRQRQSKYVEMLSEATIRGPDAMQEALFTLGADADVSRSATTCCSVGSCRK
jgi:hypothetical protein